MNEIFTWNSWLLPNWYDVGTNKPEDVGRYIIPATLSETKMTHKNTNIYL